MTDSYFCISAALAPPLPRSADLHDLDLQAALAPITLGAQGRQGGLQGYGQARAVAKRNARDPCRLPYRAEPRRSTSRPSSA